MSFAQGMGLTETVRNPNNNFYFWSPEEFYDALKNQIVDGPMDIADLKNMNRNSYSNLIRFKNRHLGERVASAALTVLSLQLNKI